VRRVGACDLQVLSGDIEDVNAEDLKMSTAVGGEVSE
jgi:hypothetical protein